MPNNLLNLRKKASSCTNVMILNKLFFTKMKILLTASKSSEVYGLELNKIYIYI